MMPVHDLPGPLALEPYNPVPLQAQAPGTPAPARITSPSVAGQGGRAVVAVAHRPLSAASRVAAPGDALLDRAVLNRSAVALGYLLSDQSIELTLWNTDYRRSLTLSSLELSDPDAFQLTGPGAGTRLPPGAAISYTLGIKLIGKTEINDTVRFIIGELPADSPVLTLTGSRLVVFPLSPDWSAGFDEQLQYASSVLTTHGGTEQRAMLRETPVRSLSFTVAALDGHEAGQLEALLLGWQARVFGVPVWTDERQLTAPAAAGAQVLACDTDYSEMQAGGYALLWRDSSTFDAVQLIAVGEGQVSLRYPLARAYPPGAKLIPLMFARLDESVQATHDTAAVAAAQLTFTAE